MVSEPRWVVAARCVGGVARGVCLECTRRKHSLSAGPSNGALSFRPWPPVRTPALAIAATGRNNRTDKERERRIRTAFTVTAIRGHFPCMPHVSGAVEGVALWADVRCILFYGWVAVLCP